ncbi:hypothetical protein Peur_071474 [Populus x canadensis]
MSVQQFVWKPSTVEQLVWQDLSHSGMKVGMRNNGVIGDDLLVPRSLLVSKSGILKSQLVKEVNTDLLQPEAQYSAPKPPPFKFHTAGGRSFSFSIEALKRARSLLGDPDIGTFLNEGDAFDMGLSVFEDIIFDEASSNKENSCYSAFTHPEASKSKHMSKTFISPLKLSANHVQPSIIKKKKSHFRGNLLEKSDAVHNDNTCEFNSKATCIQNCLRNGLCSLDTTVANSQDSGTGSRMNPLQRLLHVLLVDISNKNGTAYSNNSQVIFSRDRSML